MDVQSEGIKEVRLRTQVFRDVTLAVSLSEWLLKVGRDQWHTEGGDQTPPELFQSFDKDEPNSQFRGKHVRKNLIRMQVSLICKFRRTSEKGATAPRSLFSLSSTEY